MNRQSPPSIVWRRTACILLAAGAWMPSTYGLVRASENHYIAAADADAFQNMVSKAKAVLVPDARSVARSFIRQQLNVDGDDYVVAHFATAEARSLGLPDHSVPLTDALMEAFPDHSRHTFFAEASDIVGGLFGGGSESPGVVPWVDGLVHSHDAKDAASKVGRFLWSRTGPGWVYNTFFARGNMIETVGEDARSLDEAFGVYRIGGFTEDHLAAGDAFLLSNLVQRFRQQSTFAELPYVKKLHEALDAWEANGSDWPVLARYEFVQQARKARDAGLLNPDQYLLVMHAGAPQVPLSGPVSLAQLRDGQPAANTEIRRFDINGYTSSDLIRFVAADRSEVMYVPGGDPAFVVAPSEDALRQWVLAQARDAAKRESLLAHFSIYDGQDGTFYTGVRRGLEKLASGQWQADGGSVDHLNALIAGDVFEDMWTQTKLRLRDDDRMQASTAWEAWRTAINRAVTIIGPLGMLYPIALETQVATLLVSVDTGIGQGIDGRTEAARKEGLEQAGTALLTNIPTGAAFHRLGGKPVEPVKSAAPPRPFFVPPKRINGRIGYRLSPDSPIRWGPDPANRLYRLPDGSPRLWVAAEEGSHVVDLPEGATLRTDGIYAFGMARYVKWNIPSGQRETPAGTEYGMRVMPVLADEVRTPGEFRIALKNGNPGPLVERQSNGYWRLASNDANTLPGSVLADVVPRNITTDPRTLNRAAEMLGRLGQPESFLSARSGEINGSNSAHPLMTMSLGQAFLDTLPGRLRDPASTTWSASEERLLGKHLAETAGHTLALYDHSGAFEWAVRYDGAELAADHIGSWDLSVYRVVGGFRVGKVGQHVHASLLKAVASVYPVRLAPGRRVSAALREATFREKLASDVENQMQAPRLERMHELWLRPLQLPWQEIQSLEEISRLHYAIEHGEPLSPAQKQALSDAGSAVLKDELARNAGYSRALAQEALARIIDERSTLLPPALDHLLVKDPSILSGAPTRATNYWIRDGRHYVRLRHLDGRTQIVETTLPDSTSAVQILKPGNGAGRETGLILVRDNDAWVPDPELQSGFASVDPRGHRTALSAIEEKLPAGVQSNFPAVNGIVDSIPPPLRRFFGTRLTAVTGQGNDPVMLIMRHPAWPLQKGYMTRTDLHGNPVPLAPQFLTAAELDAPASVNSPGRVLPEGLYGRLSPVVDTELYATLLQDSVSHPVAANRVRALVTARRLRGMLREDAHLAVVAVTSEHAVTLLMPVNAETLGFVTPGAGSRLVRQLPSGTVVIDDLLEVRTPAEDYPAQVRRAADFMQRTMRPGGRRPVPDLLGTGRPPTDFAEHMLSEPLKVYLPDLENDPISELGYVKYIRSRFANGTAVHHAGLDWLQTRSARREYMQYFAPPYDVFPDGIPPLPTDPAAADLRELAGIAMEAALRPVATPVRPSSLPSVAPTLRSQ